MDKAGRNADQPHQGTSLSAAATSLAAPVRPRRPGLLGQARQQVEDFLAYHRATRNARAAFEYLQLPAASRTTPSMPWTDKEYETFYLRLYDANRMEALRRFREWRARVDPSPEAYARACAALKEAHVPPEDIDQPEEQAAWMQPYVAVKDPVALDITAITRLNRLSERLYAEAKSRRGIERGGEARA
jgi:hypothetical protein